MCLAHINEAEPEVLAFPGAFLRELREEHLLRLERWSRSKEVFLCVVVVDLKGNWAGPGVRVIGVSLVATD